MIFFVNKNTFIILSFKLLLVKESKELLRVVSQVNFVGLFA
jgi:hypothetical protein